MDRRKQRLLLDLGYKAISDTVYSYGTIIEVISDQELFDEMKVRLSERHNVAIADDGEIGCSALGARSLIRLAANSHTLPNSSKSRLKSIVSNR